MGLRAAALNLTLATIHAVEWMREGLGFLLAWLWTSLLWAWHHKGKTVECIQEDVKLLEKIPVHLALIVTEEELCHEALARMVVWGFSAGLHYISLYDPKCKLKDEVVAFRSAISKEHRQTFTSFLPEVHVYTTQTLNHHGHSNGTTPLWPDDGHQDVVATATSICQAVVQRQLQVKDIDTNLVGEKLSAMAEWPDPDLAVICGSTSSLLGYPPWQMRLAEILFMSTHHKVTYQQFYGILQRYASTRQRFGK